MYSIKFCWQGIWKEVVIDEFIPCYEKEKAKNQFIPYFA